MKKRILAVFACAAAMLGVMLISVPKPFVDFADIFPQDSNITIFCRVTNACNATDLGGCFAVECTLQDMPAVLQQCSDVDGLSFRFAGSEKDFCRMLRVLRVQRLNEQNLCGLRVVCGCSPLIVGGVLIENSRVNIQAAFDGEFVTFGSPVILGGY